MEKFCIATINQDLLLTFREDYGLFSSRKEAEDTMNNTPWIIRDKDGFYRNIAVLEELFLVLPVTSSVLKQHFQVKTYLVIFIKNGEQEIAKVKTRIPLDDPDLPEYRKEELKDLLNVSGNLLVMRTDDLGVKEITYGID